MSAESRIAEVGATLDAGALIAVERFDFRTELLLRRARSSRRTLVVPATALAQAVRTPARQARLARLVRQPSTEVVPMDRSDAYRVGQLLARAGTSDVVDAHVVVCAQRAGQPILTSDPDDLRRLDPEAVIVPL